jgi:hypothetical protein
MISEIERGDLIMRHYWFEITDENSENCGEEFIVGAENKQDAWEIARDYFGDWELKCWGECSEEEAEMSGLDEY